MITFFNLIVFFTIGALPALAMKEDTTYVDPKDTVVVTSTRSHENILETPMAVTVIPKLVLQSQRGFGMDEALTLVPGVLAQSRSGNTDVRIQVRGFGARGAGERSNAGTSRGIRFYQDGIPETEPDGRTSFDIINMTHASSIEVLRSNSSALWGNASGGVVSVSTIPDELRPFVELGGGLGSFGYNNIQLLTQTMLNNEGQLYLSLVNQSTNGWRVHSKSDLLQGTIGIKANVDERTRFKTFIAGAWNRYEIPGALTYQEYLDNPQQAQDNPDVYNPTYVGRDEFRDNKIIRIGSTFEHDLGNGDGISATAFVQSKALQRSERNTWRDFTRYHIGGNGVYRNIMVINESLSNKFLLGTDIQYQDGSILFYNLDTAASTNGRQVGRGTTLRDNKREGALNLGMFFQDEVIIDNISIVGGFRYDAITYYSESRINPIPGSSKTYSRLTPKLGLTYQYSDILNIYASLGGGIEVPAANETDPPAVRGEDTLTTLNPLLEPIVSTTYEVGFKGISPHWKGIVGSFRYDAAAFYIDVRNDIIPYRNGRFYQTAGRSRRVGAEFGASVVLLQKFTLFSSLTLMQTEYLDYTIDSGYIDESKTGITVSYSGNQMAGIPTFFTTVRLRYDLPMVRGMFAEAEVRRVGSYFASDDNTIIVDGYTIVDATLGTNFNLIQDQLDVRVLLRANNLTSASYMASAWLNPDRTPGGVAYIEPGLPLNISGTLTMRVHL
ncbi:MAG: TonB-dependent receptor [Ignavibacteria bacterium]|nr:TonB-dependent receptor [Ignavibacteria bacterium]